MENKKSDGFTLIELIGVIAILAIIISLGTGIYINIRKNALEKQYENVIERIENKALEYARDLNTTEVLNLSVQFLIDKGYIMPDDNNYIYDPRDNSILNCYMVHVIFDDGSYEATWTGNEYKKDGECDFSKLEAGDIEILCNGSSCKDDWYNNDLMLTFIGLSYDLNNSKIEWTSLHGEYQNALNITVNPTSIIDTMYKLKITPNDANKQVREAKANIKIDKEKPIVVSATLGNGTGKWVTSNSLTFELSDKNGSGVYGYALTKDSCDVASYIKALTNKVTVDSVENGTYKLCVKDNAGNTGEYKNEIVVTKVDDIDPKINVETSKDWDLINTATITFKDEESGLAAYGIEDENGFVTWVNVSEAESRQSHTITKTYGTNKTYKAYAKDIAGNEKEANVIINRIDTEEPKIEIINNSGVWARYYYVSIQLTDNESGLLNYQVTREDKEPSSWGSVSGNTITKSYYISSNGTYYVWVRDKVGHLAKASFTISNIDSKAPTVKVKNENATWINVPRDVTIQMSDTESGPNYMVLEYYDQNLERIRKTVYNTEETITVGKGRISYYAYDNVNNSITSSLPSYVDIQKPATPYLYLDYSEFVKKGENSYYYISPDGYRFDFDCSKNEKYAYETNHCIITLGAGSWVSVAFVPYDGDSGIEFNVREVYYGSTLVQTQKKGASEGFDTFMSSNSRDFTQKIYSIDKAGNQSENLVLDWKFR